jgi:hypothetical protein
VKELLTLILGPKALLVAARVDLADGLDADRVEQLSTESTGGCSRWFPT